MRAYWFSNNGLSCQKTQHDVGQTYYVKGEIVPCRNGLHGSVHPADALNYATGNTLDLVELGGDIVPHGDPVDKYAASQRTHLARIDATGLLRAHARWCALSVEHLWEMPDTVRRYLETGDETLRAAARAAARAAWAAARAAREAARDAAWAAAWAAARAAARDDLKRRVEAAFQNLEQKGGK